MINDILKKIFGIIIFINLGSVLLGCNAEKGSVGEGAGQSNFDTSDKDLRQVSSPAEDDFSDLKKQELDESCESEEDIKKAVIKDSQPFQLQGGEPDCEVE